MKQLITLAIVLLLSSLLVLPALADQPKETAAQQLPEQAMENQQDPHKSEAFKRQQTYQEKRKAMRERRDEALKIRNKNVRNNNPGNTGL